METVNCYDDEEINNCENETVNYYDNEEVFGIDYGDSLATEYNSEDVFMELVSLEDGFNITRNNRPYIDLEYWAEITGYTEEQIIKLANGKLIWKDPKQLELGADYTMGWVTREDILTGNRIRRLKEAKQLNEKYGQLGEVIKLLEDNLPEEVSGEDIHVNFGATWLLSAKNILAEFIASLLKMRIPPGIEYDDYRGKWAIDCHSEPNSLLNNYTYGTKYMSALSIIEHKMNNRPIRVTVPEYDYENAKFISVFSKEETLIAEEKCRDIYGAFYDFCYGNRKNVELMQVAYSDWFGYGMWKIDGGYLKIKDAEGKITLYPHQKDAIAHILARHNVLLAHDVGSGKTYEYSCGIHELIRLKISKKALVVVPNTTLEAAATAYKSIFPNDHVIICRPRYEFSPLNRADTLEMIRTTRSAVIFMAYSSFDMITMTKKYACDKKNQQLRECARQIENATNYAHKLALEAMLRRMEKSVEKYKDEFKDGVTACFDRLGIDILVVDEAHNYKNITLNYKANNLVGMHNKGSKKADDMLEKVRYIQEKNGHVIFATATPVTNSMEDIYVFQYYLQPEELKLCKIYHPGDWINTFCEEKKDFEMDVDSKNCRFTTRFSRFHNLPELMAMFSEVCDFYRSEGGELGLPAFNGYTDVVVTRSEELKTYIDEIALRTEAIRNHEVKQKDDNLLKITVQGRLAALHMCNVRPELEAVVCRKENKVKVTAQKMAEMYFKYPDTCQIGFCDSSTPKKGFNVYDNLRDELIDLGVAPHRIAYVHDAVTESQRTKLEIRFNSGDIRILIGSTAKLGTGCNVQERLIAVHHIDVPWRPADMVQRNGRIIRQGNTCKEVYIFRYITESSFDAYTYQILENKQKFIAQFLSGTLSSVHRDEGDCADTVLSYAEIKALAIGNPLIKERVEVANKLEHARINQKNRKKELTELENLEKRLPNIIMKRKQFISNTESDIDWYNSCKEVVDKEERRSFGEELICALHENYMKDKEQVFSEYQGFLVMLPQNMEPDKPHVFVQRIGGNRYTVKMDGDKAMGICQRLDHCLENLDKELDRHKDKLRELYIQEKQARLTLIMGNIYDEEVCQLADKLAVIDEKLKEGA